MRHRIAFAWSMVGNAVPFMLRGDLSKTVSSVDSMVDTMLNRV
jgi:hypothetical protein